MARCGIGHKLCFLLMVAMLFYSYQMYWTIMHGNEVPSNFFEFLNSRDNTTVNDTAELESPVSLNPDTQFVLILAYQRGGSTFTAELFNRNPDAFYWFEPVEPVYTALYGTIFGNTLPLDILYERDKMPRRLPEFEEKAVLDQLTRMYQCQLTRLEPQTLLHNYMLGRRSVSYSGFVTCLNQTANVTLPQTDACQRTTVPYCGVALSPRARMRTDRCHRCLDAARRILDMYPNHQPSGTEVHRLSTHASFANFTRKHASACIRQRSCTRSLMTRADLCVDNFTLTCDLTSLRAVKEIRISMDLAGKLMERLPNLKIIHLLRDPRGILSSRIKTALISRVAGICRSARCIKKEADFLCRRIMRDLDSRTRLETQYKNRILELQYEALAGDPKKYAGVLYDFLGLPVPEAVLEFMIPTNTSDNTKIKYDNYGTKRLNSSVVANAWRKYLVPRNKIIIDEQCAEFFKVYPHYTR